MSALGSTSHNHRSHISYRGRGTTTTSLHHRSISYRGRRTRTTSLPRGAVCYAYIIAHPTTWATSRVCRNMRDRILAILDHFSQWDSDATPYPTPLQTLAKRLHNERTDSQIEIAQRRHVEQMQEQILQSANDEREGTLGLLPRACGTGIPSAREASVFLTRQMEEASSLLVQNPTLQNNSSK